MSDDFVFRSRTTTISTSSNASIRDCLERDGFVVLRSLSPSRMIEKLREVCSVAAAEPVPESTRRSSQGGIRHLLTTLPEVKSVVSDSPFIDVASEIDGPAVRPVYGVFFDKTPLANWNVPWHQDLTIRVRQHRDLAGFEPRPGQDGSTHMIPPIEVTEQILAMRIHLDDATQNHGALRVIAGSHRLGRMSNDQIQSTVATTEAHVCEVRAGDVMIMRPLLLHTSSRCESPGHRRVIHIEYAAFDLPGGLEWHG